MLSADGWAHDEPLNDVAIFPFPVFPSYTENHSEPSDNKRPLVLKCPPVLFFSEINNYLGQPTACLLFNLQLMVGDGFDFRIEPVPGRVERLTPRLGHEPAIV